LNNFDVLISDIDEKTLQTEISRVFGIDYLAEATQDDAKREIDVIKGYVYATGVVQWFHVLSAMIFKLIGCISFWRLMSCSVPFREGIFLPVQRVYLLLTEASNARSGRVGCLCV